MQKTFYILFFLVLLITSSLAQETFLSLKKNKVNVRYGPSFDSDIKYVYKKINLPIKQIDKKENFRRIIDLKNNSGWIHISQLKKINSVISTNDKILFKKPSSFAAPRLCRRQRSCGNLVLRVEPLRPCITHKVGGSQRIGRSACTSYSPLRRMRAQRAICTASASDCPAFS